MKKILFISYEFLPIKSGGVYRPLGFIKYLKEFNYEPIILTLDLTSLKKTNLIFNIDESLGADIISQNKILHIPTSLYDKKSSRVIDFLNIYFNPIGREAIGWKNNFNKYANEIIQKEKPELIFVTAPPFSVLLLAKELSKKHELPLVVDFRDAWSNWVVGPYASYFHYLNVFLAERKILKSANKIVVTSKQTIADFCKLHLAVSNSKFYYIPNGYDGELNTWVNELVDKKEIVIGYVGSFYYSPNARESLLTPWYKKRGHKILQYTPSQQDWLYRSPFYFFKTLSQLFILHPVLKDKVKVKFAGRKPEWLQNMVKEFNLEKIVEFLGVLPHAESIKFQRKVDMVLITSSKVIDGLDYSIAGKTYEYFQNQKPILAFVCEGAQKEILEESGMAIICDPDNIEKSSEILFNALAGKVKLNPNISFLNGLNKRKLTGKLVEVFDECLLEKFTCISSLKKSRINKLQQ